VNRSHFEALGKRAAAALLAPIPLRPASRQNQSPNPYRQLLAVGLAVLVLCAVGLSAQDAGYASWDALDRERDKRLPPEPILDRVGLKPGMVVGEVGAGAGYFTFKLAARVGPSGKVYANDIDAERLDHLERRAAERNLRNIVRVVGDVADTRLPKRQLDMVVMVNTFHDLEEPIALLANLVPTLKPNGTLVILDYDDDKAGKALETPGHFYTVDKTLSILAKSAFVVDRVERIPPMNVLVVLSPRKAPLIAGTPAVIGRH
jgi:SAM-dependent methyltransferase